MSATTDPIETPSSVNIASLNTFYGGLPIEGPTEEDQAWMNAPMGAVGTLMETRPDPWLVVGTLVSLANFVLLAAVLLK